MVRVYARLLMSSLSSLSFSSILSISSWNKTSCLYASFSTYTHKYILRNIISYSSTNHNHNFWMQYLWVMFFLLRVVFLFLMSFFLLRVFFLLMFLLFFLCLLRFILLIGFFLFRFFFLLTLTFFISFSPLIRTFINNSNNLFYKLLQSNI